MRHAGYVIFFKTNFYRRYSERESYLYIVFGIAARYCKFKSYPGVILL